MNDFQGLLKSEEDNKLKVLIFGKPGVGKTTFLHTLTECEESNPTLLLDAEGGTTSIVGSELLQNRIAITSSKEFVNVLTLLQKGNHPYKAIAIDSYTELHNMLLREATGHAVKSEWSHYGEAMVKMQKFTFALKSLPYHIIFTCQLDEDSEPLRGKVSKPKMVGKYGDMLKYEVDASIYFTTKKTESGKVEYLAVLNEQTNIDSKFRTPLGKTIPDVVKDLTFSKVLEFTKGGRS